MSAELEARVAMLERQIAALLRRSGVPFALTQSTLPPNDAGPVQTVQMQLDPLSVRDDVPVLYHYGFASAPPMGANFHVAYLDADRSKAVAIASGHQSYRMKNLAPGESALYDLVRGTSVHLSATGIVIDGAGLPITVQNAPVVTVGTTAAPSDLHVTGNIIHRYGSANQVGLGTHTHMQGNDSRGDAEVPTNPPTAGT